MFIRVSEHAKDMFIKRHSDKQAYKFSVIKNEKNEAIMFNKLIKLIFDLYENLKGLEVVEKFNCKNREDKINNSIKILCNENILLVFTTDLKTIKTISPRPSGHFKKRRRSVWKELMRNKALIYKSVQKKIEELNTKNIFFIDHIYCNTSNNLVLTIKFQNENSLLFFEDNMKNKNMKFTKQSEFILLWTHNLQKDNFWKAFKNLIECLPN